MTNIGFKLKKLFLRAKKFCSHESFRYFSNSFCVFKPIVLDFINRLNCCYYKCLFFIKITYVLNRLFVKFSWSTFLFYSFSKHKYFFTDRKFFSQLFFLQGLFFLTVVVKSTVGSLSLFHSIHIKNCLKTFM